MIGRLCQPARAARGTSKKVRSREVHEPWVLDLSTREKNAEPGLHFHLMTRVMILATKLAWICDILSCIVAIFSSPLLTAPDPESLLPGSYHHLRRPRVTWPERWQPPCSPKLVCHPPRLVTAGTKRTTASGEITDFVFAFNTPRRSTSM